MGQRSCTPARQVSAGTAHYLWDLLHPDDRAAADDLLDEANGKGRAQRIIRVRSSGNGPRFLDLKISRHPTEFSISPIPGRSFGNHLFAQGWDVTDLILRQRELQLRDDEDPLAGATSLSR